MPTYVMLTTLTPKGRETMHSHPDRLKKVNHEVEAFGCKILAQYALLGRYDFLTIIHAPDNETVAHLAVDLGSRGTINVETLPAISTLLFLKKLRGPKQMGRKRK